jgi:hypothetical protein
MARFRCRTCNQEGTFEYAGGHACPKCGSRDVQIALSIHELSDDDPIIVALTQLAETKTDDTEDET